ALADHVRVVVEHGAVEIEQALLVDVDLRAVGPFEDLIAEPGLLLPRERVAQPRAPAALHADAQPTFVDALLGHQRADLARGGLTDLNHDAQKLSALSQCYAVGCGCFSSAFASAVCC